MFSEGGRRTQTDLDAMAEPFRRWLAPRLDDQSYFGFIVEAKGQAIAGVGLMVTEWPPHPSHPTDDRRGYALNMYVEPEYRGRGIARNLMEAADREFKNRGIGYVILHATKMGRAVYERFGWVSTSEMAKALHLI
jgi:GNAT superfamily N-acetyltransferase